MNNKEPLDPSAVPEDVLNTLGEFTYGGFVLFFFDSEGFPQMEVRADDPMASIALQKHALDTLISLDRLGRKQMLQLLQESLEEETPPEEDEEGV